jgi:methylenetetrahydrofolate reductase (NADPH)
MRDFRCPKFLINGPCEEVFQEGGCCAEPGETCVFVYPDSLLAAHPFEANRYVYRLPLDWSASSFDGRGRPKPATPEIELALPPDLGPERTLRSDSKFERSLREGGFVTTCEVIPPASTNLAQFLNEIGSLRGRVHAVQVADNAHANLQASGLITAHLLERMGLETGLNMTCRDRNRNQLQSDLLGAYAVGVKNIRCLTGEPLIAGNNREVKPVFDLDQVHLIQIVKHLRDTGTFMSGRKLHSAPRVFIGATVAPMSPPQDYRIHDLGMKVAAGADYAVTHAIFDTGLLRDYLLHLKENGLGNKVFLIASLGVLTSPENARAISRRYPGVVVPESLVARLDAAPQGMRRREGLNISLEILQQLHDMPGIAGINWLPSMSDVRLEEILSLCELAQLTPRPAPSFAPVALEMPTGDAI